MFFNGLILKSYLSRGFTLIELLVVLSIIGIVASIAVPKYLPSQSDRSNIATAQKIKVLADAIKLYRSKARGTPEQNRWPAKLDDIVNAGVLPASVAKTLLDSTSNPITFVCPGNRWQVINLDGLTSSDGAAVFPSANYFYSATNPLGQSTAGTETSLSNLPCYIGANIKWRLTEGAEIIKTMLDNYPYFVSLPHQPPLSFDTVVSPPTPHPVVNKLQGRVLAYVFPAGTQSQNDVFVRKAGDVVTGDIDLTKSGQATPTPQESARLSMKSVTGAAANNAAGTADDYQHDIYVRRSTTSPDPNSTLESDIMVMSVTNGANTTEWLTFTPPAEDPGPGPYITGDSGILNIKAATTIASRDERRIVKIASDVAGADNVGLEITTKNATESAKITAAKADLNTGVSRSQSSVSSANLLDTTLVAGDVAITVNSTHDAAVPSTITLSDTYHNAEKGMPQLIGQMSLGMFLYTAAQDLQATSANYTDSHNNSVERFPGAYLGKKRLSGNLSHTLPATPREVFGTPTPTPTLSTVASYPPLIYAGTKTIKESLQLGTPNPTLENYLTSPFAAITSMRIPAPDCGKGMTSQAVITPISLPSVPVSVTSSDTPIINLHECWVIPAQATLPASPFNNAVGRIRRIFPISSFCSTTKTASHSLKLFYYVNIATANLGSIGENTPNDMLQNFRCLQPSGVNDPQCGIANSGNKSVKNFLIRRYLFNDDANADQPPSSGGHPSVRDLLTFQYSVSCVPDSFDTGYSSSGNFNESTGGIDAH